MVLQSWKTNYGQRFLNSGGLGSMGFALSAGYGVSKKNTTDRVLVIESDGSFSMNIQDLETISNSMGPLIKIVVLNSGGYKSIGISQGKQNQLLHGESKKTGLNLPDISKWAEAAGLEYQSESTESDLEARLAKFWNSPVHSILELKVSSTEEALPRLISKPSTTGQMQTADFVDLFPEVNLGHDI
jgi:acetolactate synthase-1/2/3 large subunit